MVSFSQIILEYVVPSVGVVTSSMMASAAYIDVRKAILSSALGSLNPTPWAFMLGNQLGWIAYSFMIQNIFVFLSNGPGFLLSVWLNMAAVKLQFENHRSAYMRQYILEGLARKLQSPSLAQMARKQHKKNVSQEKKFDEEYAIDEEGGWTHVLADFGRIVWDIASENKPAPAPHERLVLYIVTFWTVVLTVVAFGGFAHTTRELIVGIVVNINLIFVYAAPLSAVLLVLRTKSSASIHVPTMLCNSVNSTLWMVYGFAVNNPFILIPNTLGTLLGIMQVVLTLLYPSDYEALPAPPPPGDAGSDASSASHSTTGMFLEEEKAGKQAVAPLIIGPVPSSVMVDQYQIA